MELKGIEHLRELIRQAKWTKAKTYKPPFDHEYIVMKKYPELCTLLRLAIDRYGYDKDFLGQRHRYIDIDGYRYWHYQMVFNRDIANKKFHT
jgi:hypothetical protein